MAIGWVPNDDVRRQQSAAETEDIPQCSMCNEKPDHIGKLVAGPDEIFLCRNCIINACEVLKDTGFPVTNEEP